MHLKLFLITLLLMRVSAEELTMDLVRATFGIENITEPPKLEVSDSPGATLMGLIETIFTAETERAKFEVKKEEQSNKSCGLNEQCVRKELCSPRNNYGASIIKPPFAMEDCPSTEVCCSIDNIVSDSPGATLMGLIETIFAAETERPEFEVKKEEQSNKSCGLNEQCVRKELCSPRKTDGTSIINQRFAMKDCSSTEVCCSIADIVSETLVMPSETPTGCGYRNTDGVGPRFGQTATAEFGEFPWMLMIMRVTMYDGKDRNTFYCGGSLIHPKVALTGAHCVYRQEPTTFKVRAGDWDLSSVTELHPHQDRQVVDMVLHAEYNKNNLRFDIALLFLQSPFELGPNVNTVCLPPVGHNFNAARCYASGWGRNAFPNGEYQQTLRKVDLPVVSRITCQDYLRQTRLGRYFNLHWSFLCAGGEPGKDICQSGGSPLVCEMENDKSRVYQAGLVAWGIGCFEEKVPRIFANVAEFRPWIDEQLANRNINASYFTP